MQWSAKRWPQERFVEAARVPIERRNAAAGGFSGRDVALAEGIARQLPKDSVQSLAGKTSLRELCAALKACDVVLTNDTGPMHVAAAVGTPVVVPFGSTCPELTAPAMAAGKGDRTRFCDRPRAPPASAALCPIDFRCMTSITVDSAVQAVCGLSSAANLKIARNLSL